MFNWSTQDIFPHPSAENGHDLVDVGIRNDAPDQVERSWSPPPRQALLIENLWVHMGGFRAWRWVWHALITCQLEVVLHGVFESFSLEVPPFVLYSHLFFSIGGHRRLSPWSYHCDLPCLCSACSLPPWRLPFPFCIVRFFDFLEALLDAVPHHLEGF